MSPTMEAALKAVSEMGGAKPEPMPDSENALLLWLSLCLSKSSEVLESIHNGDAAARLLIPETIANNTLAIERVRERLQ